MSCVCVDCDNAYNAEIVVAEPEDPVPAARELRRREELFGLLDARELHAHALLAGVRRERHHVAPVRPLPLALRVALVQSPLLRPPAARPAAVQIQLLMLNY